MSDMIDKCTNIRAQLSTERTRIIALKLISGEEIIVDASISTEDDATLILHKPLILLQVDRERVKFTRWIWASQRPVHTIDMYDVLTAYRPSTRVINAYFQRTKVVFNTAEVNSDETVGAPADITGPETSPSSVPLQGHWIVC